MTTDGGGWTLVADYRSNLELFNFDHPVHQVQNDDGGASVGQAPALWEAGVAGHVAYTAFPIAGRELKLQGRTSATGSWYAVKRSDLFNAWNVADYGTYGSSSGWGTLGSINRGRSTHYICGYQVNTSTTGEAAYPGIAYCSGAGNSGSFANHHVSFSFTRNEGQYGGGLSMGCIGTGLNTGKSAAWEGQVWLR